MSGKETREARHIRETNEAAEFLRRAIPHEFQSFDLQLYPCPQAYAKVMALPRENRFKDDSCEELPGYRGGLLLHGETGSGKTRAAFNYLAQRVRTEPGDYRFTYVSAPILKRRLADAARSGKAQQIIDELIDEDTYYPILVERNRARPQNHADAENGIAANMSWTKGSGWVTHSFPPPSAIPAPKQTVGPRDSVL
jgi:hypothetical protein